MDADLADVVADLLHQVADLRAQLASRALDVPDPTLTPRRLRERALWLIWKRFYKLHSRTKAAREMTADWRAALTIAAEHPVDPDGAHSAFLALGIAPLSSSQIKLDLFAEDQRQRALAGQV